MSTNDTLHPDPYELTEAARDQLIDVLMRETLGGERVADVRAAVWAKIRGPSIWHRKWIQAVMAAAAVAMVAAGAWLWRGWGYPAPAAHGEFAILSGGAVSRGATLESTGPATVELGGYCRVDLQPGTTLRIDGARRRESVFLAKGGVVCDVDGQVGRFDVRTGEGTVSVTGTRFSVQLQKTEGEGIMSAQGHKATVALVVAVMLGSVDVEYQGTTHSVGAGATRAFGAEQGEEGHVKREHREGEQKDRERKEIEKKATGEAVIEAPRETQTTEGTVVRAGETLVLRTGSGEEQTFNVRMVKKENGYKRDALSDIALKKSIRPGMKVSVAWFTGEHDRKMIAKIQAGGTVTGVVVEPREKGVLLVKVEGVEGPMRFVCRWIKQEGKWMPDPKEVEQVSAVKTGAKVSVSYVLEEHFRINKLEVVE